MKNVPVACFHFSCISDILLPVEMFTYISSTLCVFSKDCVIVTIHRALALGYFSHRKDGFLSIYLDAGLPR